MIISTMDKVLNFAACYVKDASKTFSRMIKKDISAATSGLSYIID